VAIHVPPSVWAAVDFFDFGAHVGWDAIPCGKVSLDVGDAWLSRKSSALLKVPSVIVPEENNVLINPAHPDAAKLKFSKRRRWTYDPRLVQVAG
jgi:RES domain-containing protein